MFAISISKIVGAATGRRWSQVHTYEPVDKKHSFFGTLLLVVGLQAKQSSEEGSIDMPSFGKEVIQRFQEQYYGTEDKDKPAFAHLANSVELVSREFDQVRVELIAGVILPTQVSGKLGVIYLAKIGSGSAVVLRNNRLYRVITGGEEGEASDPGKVVTASGFINEGDVFVLGTGDFFNLVDSEVLKKAILLIDPPEISSALAPHVHGTEENSGVAALITTVRGDLRRPEARISKEEAEEVLESASKPEPKALTGLIGFLGRRLGDVWSIVREGAGRLGKRPIEGPSLEEGEIVLREEGDRRRRLMFSVAFLLLILLGISVFFGWRRRIEEERERVFQEVWEIADHQYNEAVNLAELNPMRSRALLSEAKQEIDKALVDPEKNLSKEQRQRLTDRLDEIASMLEQVSGEYRIEGEEVFLDLKLVRPNSHGEVFDLHEDTLVVLDKVASVLLRVGVKNKSADPVGGGALLSGSKLTAAYSGRGFVFSDKGVVEVSLSGKTSAVVVEPDLEWGEIVDLKVFGGNLYLLDRGNSEIFRYQSIEGGFGPRFRWFGEGVSPNLSQAVSMAIDGDIWVLTNDSILRFRRGAPEAFSISGLDVDFNDPVSIYTNDGSERIYVLDRGNRRVVVLDKNGEYREQYLWDRIEAVSDMVVSEAEGKILLLSGPIIYEIGLRG